MRTAPPRGPAGPRPAVVVLVVGTGTDVGKTWVAARLLEAWRGAGLSVAARKPAQSYAEGAGPTDAEVLGAASGENPAAVCPPAQSYPVALAPPMAADALGVTPPTVADLVAAVAWPQPGPGRGAGGGAGGGAGAGAGVGVSVGLVETAGGVRSPQADDGDAVDVGAALQPDWVVLVADAGLGTVNAVRLSLAALTDVGGPGPAPLVPVVVLNRFDASSDLHRRNLAWLRDRDGVQVVAATSEELADLAGRVAPHPAGGLYEPPARRARSSRLSWRRARRVALRSGPPST